ncbi:MAG: DUF58 domain-containing protein [Legionellales bacterium]|nr:DUF58 domain-containing protein [Legionellales bacterium]
MVQVKNKNHSFALRGTTATLSELISLEYVARTLPELTKAKISSSQFGGHVSKLKGRGIEFDEVRVYQAGDDIRRMDWRITAKTGKPHTKLFHDERDRPVYLLIDDRKGMHFGTKVAFKSLVSRQIASIVAWATVIHGDKVGAVITNGINSIELKPYVRKAGVLPLLKHLSKQDSESGEGELVDALIKLRHVSTPGSLIFIISDFVNLGKDFEKHLSRLKLHNEIVGCFIYDIFEKNPPPSGMYQVCNGKDYFTMDTSDRKFCNSYQKFFQDRLDSITGIFSKWNIPMLEFPTDEIVVNVLLRSLTGIKQK